MVWEIGNTFRMKKIGLILAVKMEEDKSFYDDDYGYDDLDYEL